MKNKRVKYWIREKIYWWYIDNVATILCKMLKHYPDESCSTIYSQGIVKFQCKRCHKSVREKDNGTIY
jgi:hypothetical protein